MGSLRIGAFGNLYYHKKKTSSNTASAEPQAVEGTATDGSGTSLGGGGVSSGSMDMGSVDGSAGLLTKRQNQRPAQEYTQQGMDELGKKVKKLQGEPNAYIGEQTGLIVLG